MFLLIRLCEGDIRTADLLRLCESFVLLLAKDFTCDDEVRS